MLIENDWVSTNICNRLIDASIDFTVKLKPYSFKETSFTVATENVIEKISTQYGHMLLSFSGGTDSEYIFRSLIKTNKSFTPIIVFTPVNIDESKRALDLCVYYDITPIKLTMNEDEILQVFKDEIHGLLGGIGYSSPPRLAAAKFAKEQNTKIICGDIIIGSPVDYVEISEWDCYTDALVSTTIHIPFFLYDMPIVQSVVKFIDPLIDEYTLKCWLYGIPRREKDKHQFSEKFISTLNKINVFSSKYTKRKFRFDKDTFLRMTDKYKQSNLENMAHVV